MTDKNVDEIKLNGEVITVDEVEERLKALIQTEKITISIGEKRQARQYEMNDYHESTSIGIDGVSPFLDTLSVDPKTRRKLSALALGLLTSRVNQMYNFMKASVHKQQEDDGIKTIDYRPGEKSNENE